MNLLSNISTKSLKMHNILKKEGTDLMQEGVFVCMLCKFKNILHNLSIK